MIAQGMLLHSGCMTHPLVRRLTPIIDGDIDTLRAIVAEWVRSTECERERAALRHFGAELGAVQRRIRCRSCPPTSEEIEIALTAVLALMHRRIEPELPRQDPAGLFHAEQPGLFGSTGLGVGSRQTLPS